MSEPVESSVGIKDIVAKLYVVRDSCKGIAHSEDAGANILWFEGASALLHQGINQLQRELQTLEQGGEGMDDAAVGGIQDIISKLYVLRDSCKGASSSENPDPHAIWFQGAQSILQEAIEQLQTAVQFIEDKGEPATAYEDEEGEESSGAEAEESETADLSREKKRIAIAK
jgi:uncharacterized protein YukE